MANLSFTSTGTVSSSTLKKLSNVWLWNLILRHGIAYPVMLRCRTCARSEVSTWTCTNMIYLLCKHSLFATLPHWSCKFCSDVLVFLAVREPVHLFVINRLIFLWLTGLKTPVLWPSNLTESSLSPLSGRKMMCFSYISFRTVSNHCATNHPSYYYIGTRSVLFYLLKFQCWIFRPFVMGT